MPLEPRRDDIINKANPLIVWKIYYHDPDAPNYFSTFSNLDGRAVDAPEFGIVLIQQTSDNGRGFDIVLYGDYYAMDEEGKWIGMDILGKEDRDLNNIPYSALKQGRWINTERFQDIIYLAGDDADFVKEPEGRRSKLPDTRLTRG